MKERPILFSAPMVRALREGRKTQTRRMVKWPAPAMEGSDWESGIYAPIVIGRHGDEEPGTDSFGIWGDDWDIKCPYGKPGDRLWVKETFSVAAVVGNKVQLNYMADDWLTVLDDVSAYEREWARKYERRGKRPAIFMPRWASRMTVEIVNVRVERVRDISEDGAKRRGKKAGEQDYRTAFLELFFTINKRAAACSNPWVWVIEFARTN